jgi:hypothetical protein
MNDENLRKFEIQNAAGRVLGTYKAEDEYGAFQAMCREAGYATGDDAERLRFANFDRCVIRDVTDAATIN